MDYRRKKVRIGDLLVETGVISEEQLQAALQKQRGSSRKLGETLVDEGFVTEEQIAYALSEQYHIEMIDLQNVTISEEILNLVSPSVLKKNRMIPIEYSKDNANVLRVAMVDPMDILSMDDIAIITNMQVEPVLATPQGIMLALDRYYGHGDRAALEQYTKEKETQLTEETDIYSEDINNSPIVQLVKNMIEQAVLQRASDIHIEPMERQLRVRYRIDGTLYEKATYSTKLLSALSARIKIIGGMDITEKRKPQDGRLTQVVNRMEYDIRASVIPTVFGEKIVLRIASKNALTRDKAQLGLNDRDLKLFDHILKNPHGIILVTGPTGSGKSTTLYTALNELNTSEVNIITVEDPVEANLDGVNQIQVNPKANLTFASALRSILRQDPDIIMIGEIRDTETAQIAVQASITGHLVVSTLHTNSAASTITRLIDMGIDSYLIADSMVGVIAQRLVRRLCPSCRRKRLATEEEKMMLKRSKAEETVIYEPTGCSRCDNTGYKGRIGVYEIMEVSPKLKSIIGKGKDAEEIKNQALEEGMYTLRMSATELVLNGTTSYSEMIKVSFDV